MDVDFPQSHRGGTSLLRDGSQFPGRPIGEDPHRCRVDHGLCSLRSPGRVAGIFIVPSARDGRKPSEPYLFSGLAAFLVGGSIFGSIRGSYTRTLLGALTLTLLSTIIVSNGLTEAQSRIVFGVIILAVVSLYGRERHVLDRF